MTGFFVIKIVEGKLNVQVPTAPIIIAIQGADWNINQKFLVHIEEPELLLEYAFL